MRALAAGLLIVCALAVSAIPTHAAEISGRVLDDDGRPVAGARVEVGPTHAGHAQSLRWVAGERLPEPWTVVTSDAHGFYRFDAPTDRLATVRLFAPGYVPMTHGSAALLDPQRLPTVRLRRDAGLEVTVLSATDGRPLAGGRVWFGRFRTALEGWRENSIYGWYPLGLPVATDSRGRARVPRAPGEKLALKVWAPGHLDEAVTVENGAPTRVRLAPALPQVFEIRDPRGKSLPGIVLRVLEHGWSTAVTDANGRAEVGLPAGESVLHVSAADGHWTAFKVPALEELQGKPSDGRPPMFVVLPDPHVLTGRVTSAATGEPLPGALVRAEDGLPAAQADDGGYFALRIPATATDLVVIGSAPGHPEGSIKTSFDPTGRVPTPPLEIALTLGAFLRGRVVDGDGNPLPGIALSWNAASNIRNKPRAGGLTSDENGRFVIGPFLPQPMELRAAAEGFAPVEVLVRERELVEPVEVILTPGSTVVGRLVGPAGEPASHARVDLYESSDPVHGEQPWRPGGTPSRTAVSGIDGRFEIAAVPAGLFRLRIEPSGYAPRTLGNLVVDPEGDDGAVLDLQDIPLEDGLRIVGRVVDGTGAPVPNTRVLVGYSELGGHLMLGNGALVEQRTGADGRFRFEHLEASELLAVAALAPKRAPALARGVTPAPGEAAEPVVLTLVRGARLYGRVVDSRGEPISRQLLHLVPATPDSKALGESLLTGADGRFDESDLPPGRWVLRLWNPRGEDLAGMPVELLPGGEVGPLRLVGPDRSVVVGHVLTADGRPARGAQVELETASSHRPHFRRTGETDAAGAYRLDHLSPASVTLTARHPDHGLAHETIEVQVGEQRVDLRLAESARIDLEVTVDETAEPVADARVTWSLLNESEIVVSESGRTDRDGRLTLRPRQAGTYRIHAWADGVRPRSVEVTVGERSAEVVRLALSTGVTMHGRLLGLDPARLADAGISVDQGPYAERQSTEPDRHGDFRVSGLAPGLWSVQATAGGTEPIARKTIEIADGETDVFVELDVTEGLTLTGRVRYNGEPASGWPVAIRPESPTLQRIAASTFTDHRGAFVLRGLAGGVYRMTIGRDGLRHERSLDLSGDDAVEVEVEGGSLTGRVLTSDGEPAARLLVRLESPPLPDGSAERVSFTSTDEEGRFTTGGLLPGEYRITIRSYHGDSGGRVDESLTRAVVVTPPAVDVGTLFLDETDEAKESDPE